MAERGEAAQQGQRERLNFHLYRNDGHPVSIRQERTLEALSFPWLYPDGKNHWGWTRQKLLTTKMFFRQRILNNDTRFLKAGYIGRAVSTSQYFQLLDSVDVALRLQRGSINVGQLRERLLDGTDANRQVADLNLEKNCWAFMRNIRGTAAYWQDAGSDVFAMLRTLRPPIWFVTLSANEAGWDNLQLVLHGKAGLPLDEQADFLASLTWAARQKAARDDPVSSSGTSAKFYT